MKYLRRRHRCLLSLVSLSHPLFELPVREVQCACFPTASCISKHRDLSSRNRLNSHFVEMAKRSRLLDMAGMKRNLSNQESWIFSDIYRGQFSSIEPSIHLIKSKSHRFANS